VTEELERLAGSLRHQAAAAWAEWIPSLADWQHFLTLTTSRVLHPEAFLKKETLLMSLVSEELWGKNYSRRGHGLSYLSSLERQKRWAPHSHMLVDQERLPYEFIHKTWQELGGFAWVVPVGNIGGVSAYVSKYVVEEGDIELRLHRPGSRGQGDLFKAGRAGLASSL
jgi:hypothetical protein